MEAVLVGYSGHGLVIAESALSIGIKIQGYTELNKKKYNPFEIRYIGHEASDDFIFPKSVNKFILGIGSNRLRANAFNLIKSQGKTCLKIINPSSCVSKFSSIGEGTFIARSASVNPFTNIGKYCIINTSSSVDHECNIEDGVHIAPGAVLCGNVKIGKNTFIGANAVIKEGVKVGENSIVGVGSVVLSDVNNNSIIYGNPAK